MAGFEADAASPSSVGFSLFSLDLTAAGWRRSLGVLLVGVLVVGSTPKWADSDSSALAGAGLDGLVLVELDAAQGAAVLRWLDGLRVVRVGDRLGDAAEAPRVVAVQPDRLVLEVMLGGEARRRAEAWVEILRPGDRVSRVRVVDTLPDAVFGGAPPVWIEDADSDAPPPDR